MENYDTKNRGKKYVEYGPPVDVNFDSFFIIERLDDVDVSIYLFCVNFF